jgi:hypothetical protein
MTETVWIYLIGAIATFAGSILTAAMAMYNNSIARRNEQHILEAKATIKTLEENTNHKMDELLDVTAKSEHAKGLLEAIAIPPVAGPAGPAGPPGREGERGREGPRGEIGRTSGN